MGVLSIDALELSPCWDSKHSLNRAKSGLEKQGEDEEEPLIGSSQWHRLGSILEEQVGASCPQGLGHASQAVPRERAALTCCVLASWWLTFMTHHLKTTGMTRFYVTYTWYHHHTARSQHPQINAGRDCYPSRRSFDTRSTLKISNVGCDNCGSQANCVETRGAPESRHGGLHHSTSLLSTLPVCSSYDESAGWLVTLVVGVIARQCVVPAVPSLTSPPPAHRCSYRRQDTLVTLIVVTELPIVWHDTEAFLAERKVPVQIMFLLFARNAGCLSHSWVWKLGWESSGNCAP